MFRSLSSKKAALRGLVGAAFVAAASTFVAAPADAHFVLTTPPASISQDALGSPQKLAPCGNEAGGTATGEVTAFQAGQTITITIDEKIFHPGHYRVALAVNDPSELPEEPPVTAGSTACGSTVIMDPPVFPVLADGALLHSTPFNGPQTIQVTIPADVSCEKCTLQVIEFMSNHGLNNPGGCFYHHCADIKVSSGTGGTGGTGGAGGTTTTPTTGGTGGGGNGGATASGGGGEGGGGGSGSADSSGGCGCSVPAGETSPFAAIAGLFGLAALLRRRRR